MKNSSIPSTASACSIAACRRASCASKRCTAVSLPGGGPRSRPCGRSSTTTGLAARGAQAVTMRSTPPRTRRALGGRGRLGVGTWSRISAAGRDDVCDPAVESPEMSSRSATCHRGMTARPRRSPPRAGYGQRSPSREAGACRLSPGATVDDYAATAALHRPWTARPYRASGSAPGEWLGGHGVRARAAQAVVVACSRASTPPRRARPRGTHDSLRTGDVVFPRRAMCPFRFGTRPASVVDRCEQLVWMCDDHARTQRGHRPLRWVMPRSHKPANASGALSATDEHGCFVRFLRASATRRKSAGRCKRLRRRTLNALLVSSLSARALIMRSPIFGSSPRTATSPHARLEDPLTVALRDHRHLRAVALVVWSRAARPHLGHVEALGTGSRRDLDVAAAHDATTEPPQIARRKFVDDRAGLVKSNETVVFSRQSAGVIGRPPNGEPRWPY